MIPAGLQRSSCTVCGKTFTVDIQHVALEVKSPASLTLTLHIEVPPDDRLDHAECIRVVQT